MSSLVSKRAKLQGLALILAGALGCSTCFLGGGFENQISYLSY